MGIKAIDLRRGVAVEWNNKLYTVHDFAKVSKGNWRSFMQVKLRDTGTGSIIEQRFRVDDELQQAFLDQQAMEYLYSEPGKHHFMNPHRCNNFAPRSSKMTSALVSSRKDKARFRTKSA